MNAPAKLSIIEQIRARDGDKCWLCDGKLDFAAEPNSKKAPTREHLVAQSLGGGNELSNLVLCHPGCNRMLADRPLEQKQKLRAKMTANRAKVAAKKVVAAPPPAVPSPFPVKAATKGESRLAIAEARLRRWQFFGLASAGAALLAIGLASGLLLAQ